MKPHFRNSTFVGVEVRLDGKIRITGQLPKRTPFEMMERITTIQQELSRLLVEVRLKYAESVSLISEPAKKVDPEQSQP